MIFTVFCVHQRCIFERIFTSLTFSHLFHRKIKPNANSAMRNFANENYALSLITRKIIVSPKPLEIFEFCEQQYIKKFTKNSTEKFQPKMLINEFSKKYISLVFTNFEVIARSDLIGGTLWHGCLGWGHVFNILLFTNVKDLRFGHHQTRY